MGGYATPDLALAGYLKFRGLKLVHVDRTDPKRVIFCFDGSQEQAEQIAIEFANSEFERYNAEVRALKKLIYRG